ncbi:1-acyl-sn-glycerol-3-phosphate acyltransferase [Serinibacter arcticus]|uniref:1-acyl-sn-glycerol-3-phosphate acyltransferase n=1 Tax=Serinibacter arcticus TaxID=1655435 RepID=A0A2U1ZVN3_9MICO|nr:lysophospholipid acyltransferase family protein [Serinibacter arcticus]PWD51003.1 1-acyl-sn-glycerol-3-phosphate acyltransferase [Serinibacter arcticus]
MPALMPEWLARWFVLRSIGRSLRHSLASVAVAGELPRRGAVIAANHGSWWDGYLLGGLAGAVGRRSSTMMTAHQLATFPFLRLVGAVGTDGSRALVRSATDGRWVVVFPEGDLQAGPALAPLHPGAAWIARTAGVPLVPVAVRFVLRGAPQPEAVVRFGEPIDVATLRAPEATVVLAARLEAELERLDADLAAADPEHDLVGYRVLLRGSAGRRDDVGLQVRALAWFSGVPSVRR